MAKQQLSSKTEEELVLEEKENQNEKELIEKILRKARLQFTFTCLKKVRHINQKENHVFSPYDIYNALLLLYFASKGFIERLLKQILYLSDIHFPKYKLMEYYSSKEAYLPSKLQDNACEFPLNTSDYNDESYCWITNMHCLTLTLMQRMFRDKLELFDFRYGSQQLIHRVNNMMENATNGFIRDTAILHDKKDSIFMELLLTTLVRFKRQNFQKQSISIHNVSKKVFHHKRIRKTYIFHLSIDAVLHVTEFPYQSNNTSLFVLVPRWYARELSNPNSYRNINMQDITYIIDQMSSEKGRDKMCKLLDGDVEEEKSNDFHIDPTFELEKDLPMHELLEALGAKDLIQNMGINMGGFIAEHKQKLYLSCAIHRTHVNVTKEDTIAGAVTGFFNGTGSSRPVRDKGNSMSFVWLIYDKLHRIVLFVGTFNKLPMLPPTRCTQEVFV